MTFTKDIEFLLSKFAHEIRNPLTTLYSTVQLIEVKHPEVKEFAHWSSLTYDIEFMNHLLDEMSDFTKSERLQPETFDFRSFLETLTLAFAASIEQSNVEYLSKLELSIHQITGDKTKLQEVFWNLLKNAYEAALPDKSVSLHAKQVDKDIIVTISDTGCGIPEERLPTIFEPFVTYKKQGTGLGLAICDHIIKAHGGTITVESTPGVGTTFSVTLKAE